MSFRVVCISRSTAAGGESIGQAVAQRLDFRYVDEQIIKKAAQQAQVDPALVAATEHRQPLLKRLLDKMPTGAGLASTVTLATGVPVDAFVPSSGSYRADSSDLRALIRATIHEVASAGRAVIVAHAASIALGSMEGVLRVLVTASPDTRVRRLAEAERISETEAERRIAAFDRERREYFRRFYSVDEELPTHYDLVINTDVLKPTDASAVITAVAGS
jgi:CMP/dCMP kinase